MFKKILAIFILTIAVVGAVGGYKNFSVDTLRFGSAGAGLRSLIFDSAEDAEMIKYIYLDSKKIFKMCRFIKANQLFV